MVSSPARGWGGEAGGGLSPISTLHTSAQINNPTCRGLGWPGRAGAGMETPHHAGGRSGEAGSGGGRRCPYRAGRKLGTSEGVSARCSGVGAPGYLSPAGH